MLKNLTLAFSLLVFCFSVQAFESLDDLSIEGEDEFLRVEEAYKAFPVINGDQVRFDWEIADAYYLFADQFSLTLVTDEGAETLEIQRPKGLVKYSEIFEKEMEIHYSQVSLKASLAGKTPPFELQLNSQGCADAGLCYPPRTQYFWVDTNLNHEETETSKFAKQNATSSSRPSTPPLSASGDTAAPFLPLIILGALVGGLILNLMPCVFPVLSLKALSFANQGGSEDNHHLHGWAYTAGVVLSFWLAAAIILLAKTTGKELGWGFQLQQPMFVALMVYLFFVMGLSLMGMFHIGTQWMGAGQNLTTGSGYKPSFFTGVLAAVVASPCTAPFMAPAIGVALSQNAFIAIVIFTSLGLGMALPFLALSYSPRLARLMPKPGPWMDTLKQALAFPLFLTCAWLLQVLGTQVGADGTALVVAGGIFLCLGIWLWQKSTSKPAIKILGVLSFILATYAAINANSVGKAHADYWQEYSPEKLAQLRAQGKPVFIDLTADWCITCKINERVALNTDRVKSEASALGITMLQGDWTREDSQITELLNQYGRKGVPLYLMYPSDSTKPAIVLPQILKPSTVIEAMRAATQE